MHPDRTSIRSNAHPVVRADPHRADLRVGDAERTATCDALSAHFTLGRLTPDELDHRLASAVAATTRADLERLMGDLPPLPPPPAPPKPHASKIMVRDVLEASMGMAALGAMGIVAVMLLGSLLLGGPTFVFALVGGSLTMFFSVIWTRLVCQSNAADERAQRLQQP